MQTNPTVIDMTSRFPGRIEREYLAGGRVKGAMLRAHISWAREWATDGQLHELIESVPMETKACFSTVILGTSWYPFAWLVDIDRAIVDVLGRGDRGILRQAGRYAAQLNLDTIFRAFDRHDPHSFFRYLSLLHAQFQDFGSATYEELGKGHGRLIHRHHRCFSPYYCESSIGYYEQCVRLHGASHVLVNELSCHCQDDTRCTFEIRWT